MVSLLQADAAPAHTDNEFPSLLEAADDLVALWQSSNTAQVSPREDAPAIQVSSNPDGVSAAELTTPIRYNPQHNLHSGPPRLRTNNNFGLSLLREISAPIADQVAPALALAVWVDWDDLARSDELYLLELRRLGHVVAATSAKRAEKMHLDLPFHVVDDASWQGVPFVAHLSWVNGERFLHILPQVPQGGLHFSGLLFPPPLNVKRAGAHTHNQKIVHMDQATCTQARGEESSSVFPGVSSLLRAICADTLVEPTLPQSAHKLDRGFGIELEYLSEACRPYGFASKIEQMRSAMRMFLEETEEALAREEALHTDEAESARKEQLRWLAECLDASLAWSGFLDNQIERCTEYVAEKMVDAWLAEPRSSSRGRHQVGMSVDMRQRCIDMLTLCGSTLKSEFTSPLPPHELRFSRGAQQHISCFFYAALASVGVAASSVRKDGHCCTALHVHVNVANSAAGGAVLSTTQLFRIIFWWIRFDLVTARFARMWHWREKSAAPMYATGAEFEYHQAVWEQSLDLPASGLLPVAGQTVRQRQYDVPSFVRAAHALVHGECYQALSEEDKRRALVGLAGGLTRYTSLNIFPLLKYGTLEFRRFHSTCDAALATRWAHFCVTFVEAFSASPWPLLERAASADVALRELRGVQEVATAGELMTRMEDHIDPRTADYFEADATGTGP